MEIEELNKQAIKILELARYMDTVFGYDECHLRIAIMAGVGDSYNAGFQSACHYQRENNAIQSRILAEQKITFLLKEEVLALSKINKLEAIKYLKKETGMLLEDCKDFVEKLIAENNNNENLQP